VGADNVGRLTQHLLSEGHLEQAEIDALQAEVQATVEDAVTFSLQSEQPSMDAAWKHLQCNRHHEVLI
jgi:TPP-dependent pyruvate/acetoin dehydrogenase alpha subunit